MTSRSAYALSLAVAATALAACGSSTAGTGTGTSVSPSAGPSTSDGLQPLRTSPFPTVSVAPSDVDAVAQCRTDVAAVTNATEAYHRARGIYASDMKTLVSAGLLSAVPSDVHYGYDAPDVDPVVLGTVAGC